MSILEAAPKEIIDKMVDIYNYMAINNNQKMALQFEDGMKIWFELDNSEYKDKKDLVVVRFHNKEIMGNKQNSGTIELDEKTPSVYVPWW